MPTVTPHVEGPQFIGVPSPDVNNAPNQILPNKQNTTIVDTNSHQTQGDGSSPQNLARPSTLSPEL
jgi:hypothetical protein